ncbi:MAG: hypothetical protein M0R06_10255 [Sphaerochaeta sp.]|jgi:hypothetical protein|nr:hypothetical protein [Sphaerochaeta sp.]
MAQGNETQGEYTLDRFERARDAIWQTPGFAHRRSTITADGSAWFPGATWVIQTAITDDNAAIFLERVDREGGQRIVLPRKVAETIFSHYEAIMKQRRSMRSKHAAETRRKKGASNA